MIQLGKREVNSRQYVSWFNFRGGDQQKLVKDLSGGERNRVHLAKLLRAGGNLLLLDEPTNDLDVDTLRALEEALVDFAGCAVVISHDRWFLDRIATHILAFEGDSQATWFEGSYAEYCDWVRETRGPEALEPHRIAYKPLVRPVSETASRARSPHPGCASLPVADPGAPDTRSPARLLVWVGRRQLGTLAIGITFGIVWMVAQALMPYTIGRGIQDGIVEDDRLAARDLGAASSWGSGSSRGSQASCATATPSRTGCCRRSAWSRSSRHHVARSGPAVRGRLSTGEVVATVTNDAIRAGGAFDITARLAGAVVSYVVVAAILLSGSVVLGLIVLVGVPILVVSLGAASSGRSRRVSASSARRSGSSPRSAPTPRQACACFAGSAASRRSSTATGVQSVQVRGRCPGRDPPVDARRRPGAPARDLRRGRHVDRRALRPVGHDRRRRPGRVLRLRRVPRDPAPHGRGSRRQGDARARRRGRMLDVLEVERVVEEPADPPAEPPADALLVDARSG